MRVSFVRGLLLCAFVVASTVASGAPPHQFSVQLTPQTVAACTAKLTPATFSEPQWLADQAKSSITLTALMLDYVLCKGPNPAQVNHVVFGVPASVVIPVPAGNGSGAVVDTQLGPNADPKKDQYACRLNVYAKRTGKSIDLVFNSVIDPATSNNAATNCRFKLSASEEAK